MIKEIEKCKCDECSAVFFSDEATMSPQRRLAYHKIMAHRKNPIK